MFASHLIWALSHVTLLSRYSSGAVRFTVGETLFRSDGELQTHRRAEWLVAGEEMQDMGSLSGLLSSPGRPFIITYGPNPGGYGNLSLSHSLGLSLPLTLSYTLQ